MSGFYKLPNKIVCDENYTINLICYIMVNRSELGVSKISIEDYIENGLGVKFRSNNIKLNNKIRDQLKWLIKNNIITCNKNIDKINLNTCITLTVKLPYELNDNNKPIKWFKLDMDNYKKILCLQTKLDKNRIFKLYCYILSKILRRNDGINNISITGGNAEVLWCSQKDICEELKISKPTLNTYLQTLKDLELISYSNVGLCRSNGKIMTPHNVYAENEVELKEGLKQSKYYWENKGWIILKIN